MNMASANPPRSHEPVTGSDVPMGHPVLSSVTEMRNSTPCYLPKNVPCCAAGATICWLEHSKASIRQRAGNMHLEQWCLHHAALTIAAATAECSGTGQRLKPQPQLSPFCRTGVNMHAALCWQPIRVWQPSSPSHALCLTARFTTTADPMRQPATFLFV